VLLVDRLEAIEVDVSEAQIARTAMSWRRAARKTSSGWLIFAASQNARGGRGEERASPKPRLVDADRA
jgi:hypothetical protein